MNIHPKIRSRIKIFYRNPTFKMEENGKESAWHKQQSGIRQGCPLSPYLFLIVMTTMFHDVRQETDKYLENQRVPGADFDEVTYADDTICISTDTKQSNEQISRSY